LIKPNFFFIGAPKCGTTSIAHHLAQHPNIFISNPKEPHFFEKEIPRGVKTLKKYESLFSKAERNHTIVGEASTGYLYSETAVPQILSYCPNAKFLVSLRNPYEMAISLHGQALRGPYENQNDFNIAWKLQNARRSGSNIPKKCRSRLLLLYEERCSLGDQIERLYSLVQPENICLVFFDDLKSNPANLYIRIFKFLNVSQVTIQNFPTLNQRRSIRWPFLTNTIKSLGRAKQMIGIYQSLGIAKKVSQIASTSNIDKPRISEEIWKDMDYKFIPQIKKIEYFSGRNLKHWYYFRNTR
jgi:hypothetical protein